MVDGRSVDNARAVAQLGAALAEAAATTPSISSSCLQIVTSGDGTVCEICAHAAENSPYTVEDINMLAAKWKDFQPPHPVVGERSNLIHPNCRCRTVPWDASRQQNVTFASAPSSPPVVLTGREIVEAFATEVRGMLKGS